MFYGFFLKRNGCGSWKIRSCFPLKCNC